MTTTATALPLTEEIAATSADDVAAVIAAANENGAAVYPIGGGTSLDYGLPAKVEGVGLSLADLNETIDYPARDMTITVEAGVTMQTLAETLAAENQVLPIDVPHADQATIGGVIASNWNGPRRFGLGTVRDYVIGIAAVDGRGRAFKGGGRVVKNVAGYDFCKLLTGSLGTLGVITSVTLRLKPKPEKSAFVLTAVSSPATAEAILASLDRSQTTPVAVELLSGPLWRNDETLGDLFPDDLPCRGVLAIGVEGSEPEVKWMIDQLGAHLKGQGVADYRVVLDDDAERLWQQLAQFSQSGECPLVLKAATLPSGATDFISASQKFDPNCSIQSHAASGVTIVRCSEFPADGLSRTLLAKLMPAATAGSGNVVVLSNPSGAEMTHQSVWGGIDAPYDLMTEVKKRFDPNNVLNPGRFVYQNTTDGS